MLPGSGSVISQGLVIYLQGTSDKTNYKLQIKSQENYKASGYFETKNQKFFNVTYYGTINSLNPTEFIKLFMSTTAPLYVQIDKMNKLAVIQYDKTKTFGPKSIVAIKGMCSKGKYKIVFNFDNRDETEAFIKKPGKEYKAVDLRFKNLATCSEDTLAHVLFSANNDIAIQLTKSRKQLVFDIYSKSIHGQALIIKPKLRSAFLHNSRDLVEAVRQDNTDPRLNKIIEEITRKFSQLNLVSHDDIMEIEVLPEIANQDQCSRIIEHLLEKYKNSVIKDQNLLRALTKNFDSFLKAQYNRILGKATIENIAKRLQESFSFPTLNATNLVLIMSMLAKELNSFHAQEGSYFLVGYHLETMISLLNIMAAIGVNGIDRKIHYEPYYDAIARFKDCKDLHVKYLACYGTQVLKLIPDAEGTGRMIFRHLFHFLKAIGYIASSIDFWSPWHMIEGVLESIPEFKKTFTFKADIKRKWFTELALVQEMIAQSSINLIKLEKYLNSSSKLKGIISEGNLHDHHFMMGFVKILWECAQVEKVKTQIATVAIQLLKEIWFDNYTDGVKAKYTLKEAIYRKQLCDYVQEMLYGCTKHSKKSIREASEAAIREIEAKLKGKIDFKNIMPIETNVPSRLFIEAVKEADPLRLYLELVRDKLREDDQVKNEEEYYIKLDGKENEMDQNPQPLKEKIKAFLSLNQYSTLVITGEAGTGKSLFTKLYTLKKLEKYNPDDYIFFHVSLPQINDPFENLMQKALFQRGIDISKDLDLAEQLMKMKIVWIFDAYDEIHFANEAEKNLRICLTNYFSKWENSKFIFTCKKELYDSLNPDVFEAEKGQKKTLYTASFDDKKIYTYLRRFVRVRTEKAKLAEEKFAKNPSKKAVVFEKPWEYTKYKTNIEALSSFPGIKQQILSNPLYLKITSEVLPYLEKRAKVINKDENAKLIDMFKRNINVIKTDLYDAYACVLAARSSVKCQREPEIAKYGLRAVDFLNYSVRVALAMKKAKVQWVYWPDDKQDPLLEGIDVEAPQKSSASYAVLPLEAEAKRKQEADERLKKDEEIRKIFEPLFTEKGVNDKGVSNMRNMYLKNQCLVQRVNNEGKNVWGFRHNDILTYYRALGEAMGGVALKRVAKLIEDDVFDFKGQFGHTV